MKNHKNLLFAVLLIGVASFTTKAQKLTVGANFITGLPIGDRNFGDEDQIVNLPSGNGFGGNIAVSYWFSDAFSAGIEIGYLAIGKEKGSFPELFGTTVEARGSILPIMVSASYYFLEDNIKPFAGLGLGYALVDRELTLTDIFFGQSSKTTWNQDGLIISPRLGAQYLINERLAINLCIQYNLIMNTVDGDIELTSSQNGQTETETVPDFTVDATNYLGINIGVMVNLF